MQRKVIKLTLCNTIKYGQRQLILKNGRFLCTFRKSTANHFQKFTYVRFTGSFSIIHIMNEALLNSDYVTFIERYYLFLLPRGNVFAKNKTICKQMCLHLFSRMLRIFCVYNFVNHPFPGGF